MDSQQGPLLLHAILPGGWTGRSGRYVIARRYACAIVAKTFVMPLPFRNMSRSPYKVFAA